MKNVLLFLEGIGMTEILVICVFVLVFFGAKRIPEFMKGIGKGVKEFKDNLRDVQSDLHGEDNEKKKQ